ncbi:MAG: ABC transporter permease [Anaerolineae bacterium]|nr:ABC transporter permease [Anaerolineae bacterium]
MNARILRTVILKDLTLYFRNRLFALITVLGIVVYILLYALLPTQVDEDLTVAMYAPSIPDAFVEAMGGSDVQIAALESDEALQQAVIDSEYMAGIVLTPEVISGIMRGEATVVTVYFASDAPPELVNALRTVLRLAFNEVSHTFNGEPLRLELRDEIVGPDMTGQQLALRNRLLPLLAVMLLVLEMMGLATLIADEIAAGTLQALLITPLDLRGLFTGKAIVGVLLAFTQSALLMALTGSLRNEAPLILLTLLISSLVITGLAFLIASVSRGLMSVMAWSLVLTIILIVPSYGVIFPGSLTNWAQFIPTYYMFDAIHQVVNFGASWGAVANNLLVLFVMGVALLAAGVVVMERKLR